MTESTSPMERFEGALLAVGSSRGGRLNGRERRWTCPAHADKKPSLDVCEGDDGGVVFICRAGCSQNDVLSSLGFAAKDLFRSRWRHAVVETNIERVADDVVRVVAFGAVTWLSLPNDDMQHDGFLMTRSAGELPLAQDDHHAFD